MIFGHRTTALKPVMPDNTRGPGKITDGVAKPRQTDLEEFTGRNASNGVGTLGAQPGPVRDATPAKPKAMIAPEAVGNQPAVYQQTSDDPLKVGGPLPPSMGRCADLYSDVRALRLQMEKETEAVKARETEIREYIINNLSKSDDTGASGLRYRAQIVMKDIPRPANWELIHKFVQTSGRFDLLQRRLGEKAVKDMLDAGEQIPGVEVVHVPEVSITKI